MGINRISSGLITTLSVTQIHNNLSILAKLQTKVSSGKNILKPSDDPVGLTRILDLANTLKTDERYARNLNDALDELKVADTAISGMTSLLHRAKELAVQGANATNSQAGRDAIAKEIDGIINQLITLGNTNIGGKFIFAGNRTTADPFSRTGDDVVYSGTPPTEDYQRLVEVSRGMTSPINVNGETLLGAVTTVANGAPPPPIVIDSGSGIFRTLMQLKLNLQDGDLDGVRQRLDEMDTDLKNILSRQAEIGATMNRFESTLSRIESRKATFTEQYAAIQNVDMAKTISDLTFQESVYQASLGVAARVIQPSLMSFLQ
jgi:flagellar hook-associated protein 3 FlgL